MERTQANAQGIARRLVVHPDIATIFHPELGSTRNAHLFGTQMHVPGTLITFEMVGGYQAAAAIMAQVRMITPAVSLGSVDTLIQHPSGLTHRVTDDETKAAIGITPGLLHLSIGIEAGDDI